MQKYSIRLGLCTDKYVEGCAPLLGTLRKIHHAPETHVSLSRVTCALDPIPSHLLGNITPAAFPLLLRYRSAPLHGTAHIRVQTRQDLFLQLQRIKHNKLKKKL